MLKKERKIKEQIMLRKERNIKEPMEVCKEGKSRLVRISILKEFRGNSNEYRVPSDSPHSAVLERDEMGEISNLINKPTDGYVNPTAATSADTGTSPYSRDITQYSGDSREVNPIPENQPECDSRTSDNITSREASPPPSCIDHEDIEIGPKPEEEHNKLLKHRTWIGPFGRAEIQTLIQVLKQT